MQPVEHSASGCEKSRLAPDIHRIIRVVSNWSAERPILSDVALFGDRMKLDRTTPATVLLAVEFDPQRMLDGFDDWIEQLRTNFSELAAGLREPVTVLTPEMKPAWSAVRVGEEMRALAKGKVRIVSALDWAAPPVAATMNREGATTISLRSRLATAWHQLFVSTHRCTP